MSEAVGIVGSGPAIEAIEAVLGDRGITAERIEPTEISAIDLGITVGLVGNRAFEQSNEAAIESGNTTWIGIELGGIGGHQIAGVDAAICRFGPNTCFECLRARVAANAGGSSPEDEENSEADSGAEVTGIDPPTARLAGTIAGRETLAALDGRTDPTVIEVPYVERELFPVPGCVCDPDRKDHRSRFAALDRAHESRDVDEALARAERALDLRIGILGEVGEAASFPVPYYLGSLCDTTPFSDVAATPQAAGVAANWDEAFMKALGEGLERYSAGVYRTSMLPEAAPSEIDRTVSPAAFVRSEETDPETAIRWVAGEELVSGSPALLPAAFVCFPPPRERHRPSITTGLGLGNSTVEALLSGLYETIERDATMLGWYSTFDPLGLSVDSETYNALERRARSENLTVSATLATQDVDVPVTTVAVHRKGEWPRFAVGSGANLDATRAAEAALAEALQNWTELRAMGPEGSAEASGAVGEYAAFPDRVDELVAPGREIPAATLSTDRSGVGELDAVLDRLGDSGLDAYGVRLTTRDLDELGFEAVRVLVPGAQPLFTGEPFFGERARAVPGASGYEPRLDREYHPYP